MAETQDLSKDDRDTSPLGPKQLSDKEINIIFEIERRLHEAKNIDDRVSAPECPTREPYLASVQIRYPRVLLLDGGRGTGKTSLLLTLVKRWHGAAGVNGEREEAPDADYKDRINKLRKTDDRIPSDGKAPTYVRVVRILDFDPLPPEMPLVAGIIEAWRPLAKRCDPPVVSTDDECDVEGDTLMESWHKLFRVAAVGWTEIPKRSGLIEQVLDREEQVQDWQRLAEHWRKFVDAVIERGECLKKPDKLPKETVFVIMIDDVDLQVRRVRELLPALRLLYHPRVFFLVAAHRAHMIDMLKLDFLGQQNELAKHTYPNEAALDLAAMDRWAPDLANSAFDKVFPRMNHWELEGLSIKEFLAFPGQVGDLPEQSVADNTQIENSGPDEEDSQNFFTLLNRIEKKNEPQNPGDQTRPKEALEQNHAWANLKSAGTMILHFAIQAVDVKLPGVMTYRDAHQLRAYVMNLSKPRRPMEVLARLLSGNADAHATGVQHRVSEIAQSGTSDIDVFTTGELAALYRPGPTEFAGDYNIVLSARPDFVFVGSADTFLTRMSSESGNRFNFTSALLAKTLEESHFAVHVTGLRWETYLSLAWTEWSFLKLSFAWTRHKHPRPDELFKHTQAWNKFIQESVETKNKLERYAFAWVYYQRKWWSAHPPDEKLSPTKQSGSDVTLPWHELIHFTDSGDEKDRTDIDTWLHSTLPLLARPEIGFPPEVQKELLKGVTTPKIKQDLKRARRRLVTDAFVAAEAQKGRTVQSLPDEKAIDGKIKEIDELYTKAHLEPSPWKDVEDVPDSPESTIHGSEVRG